VLKGTYGLDAFSASSHWQSRDTMLMLCRWADLIVMVEPRVLCAHSKVNQPRWDACAAWEPEFDAKRLIFDVGADVWGNPLDPAYHIMIKARIGEILVPLGM
jgi:hypothetical protein